MLLDSPPEFAESLILATLTSQERSGLQKGLMLSELIVLICQEHT